LGVVIRYGHHCSVTLSSTDSTGYVSGDYQIVDGYWCHNAISVANYDSLYYFMGGAYSGTPPYTYSWFIYDTTTHSTLYSGSSPNANVIIPYGDFCNVSLATTDSVGCSSYNELNLNGFWQTNNPPCNALFVLFPDSTNTHLYQGYNYSTGSNLNYSWSWGDGTSDTLPYPNHTYAAAGFYNVCLTVWNTNCSDSQCVYYNVNRMNAKNAMHSINIINTGTTGIKNINLEKSFSVYPNPVSSELTINLKDEKIEFIKIYTINSQLMMQSNTSNNKLNISQLPSNIYFVEIKTAANIYRTKFVKE
jgi:PKD repeat protein